MLGAGVSSLSREISARLAETERQPERDKRDEGRMNANRGVERCQCKEQTAAGERDNKGGINGKKERKDVSGGRMRLLVTNTQVSSGEDERQGEERTSARLPHPGAEGKTGGARRGQRHPPRYTCSFTCVFVCVSCSCGGEGAGTCFVAGAGHFTPVGPP